jgi:hypothetical protein
MNRKSILGVAAAMMLAGTSAYAQQNVGQGQTWGGQQDQQRMGQQLDRQQDQQWTGPRFGPQRWDDQPRAQHFARPGQQQFGQQDQQRMGQQFGQPVLTDQLRDSLRQAGFTRIRQVGPDRLRARGPDGQTVIIQAETGMGADRTGTLGQQPGQQQFGQQQFHQQPQQQQFGQQRDQQRVGQQQFRQTATLDEDRIRSILEMRGMTDIEGLERVGHRYQAIADWYGDEVDVVVDARTGVVIEPREMERAQVRAKLQDEGFEDVEVERGNGAFEAYAERDGTEYRFQIDPRTGSIFHQEERG